MQGRIDVKKQNNAKDIQYYLKQKIPAHLQHTGIFL